MKELKVFTSKDLRTAERVIKLLELNNFANEQLFKFNEFHTKQEKAEIDPVKRGRGRTRSTPRIKKKPRIPSLLKPGETEKSAMLCKCGGAILVEGLCGGTVSRKGYVRLGTCMECSKEFRIR